VKNPEPTGGGSGFLFTLGHLTDAARTSGDGARNSRHANGSNIGRGIGVPYAA
jgi:hypothetical protein